MKYTHVSIALREDDPTLKEIYDFCLQKNIQAATALHIILGEWAKERQRAASDNHYVTHSVTSNWTDEELDEFLELSKPQKKIVSPKNEKLSITTNPDEMFAALGGEDEN